MDPTVFHVVHLPKLTDYSEQNETATKLAIKFRELRLFALKTSPKAFAASYEVEVQRNLDQTLERLSNVDAEHWIIVDRPITADERSAQDDYIERLIEADWLGIVALIGLGAAPGLTTISAQADAVTQIRESRMIRPQEARVQCSPVVLRHHLTGMFVHPEARKVGLGKALLEAAMTKADSEARKLGIDMRCTVLVDSENISARRLYEKVGFQATGEETYAQQPRDRLGESVMSERVALHLQLDRAAPSTTGSIM